MTGFRLAWRQSALVIAAFLVCTSWCAARSGSLKPVWRIVEHPAADGVTMSNVFLDVSGKEYRIATNVGEAISPDGVMTGKVPAAALSACGGWWAGAGDIYYIMRAGHKLKVYHISMDEQAQDTTTIVRSIKL
jgi:hypothetical protein